MSFCGWLRASNLLDNCRVLFDRNQLRVHETNIAIYNGPSTHDEDTNETRGSVSQEADGSPRQLL